MAGAVSVVLIVLLAIVQGGFFTFPTCAISVVACISAGICWLRSPRRQGAVPTIPLLFVALALAYLLSTIANGASLTTISETGTWAGCAAIALLASAQEPKGRERWLKVLVWSGVAMAAVGMLVYARIIPFPGGIVAGRLEFPFQYANTAGAWFGAMALLSLLGPDGRLRSFAAIPVAAMLLTESAGVLIVFLATSLVAGARKVKNDSWGGGSRCPCAGRVGHRAVCLGPGGCITCCHTAARGGALCVLPHGCWLEARPSVG